MGRAFRGLRNAGAEGCRRSIIRCLTRPTSATAPRRTSSSCALRRWTRSSILRNQGLSWRHSSRTRWWRWSTDEETNDPRSGLRASVRQSPPSPLPPASPHCSSSPAAGRTCRTSPRWFRSAVRISLPTIAARVRRCSNTVARGQLREDNYFYTGVVEGPNGYKQELNVMPFPVTMEVLSAGRSGSTSTARPAIRAWATAWARL